MKDKLFKDIEMKRLARRDAAREAGAAAPVGGRRRGWRFAWRVLSLTLALSLLFNSVSFGIDGTAYRAARAAMEGLSLDGGDYAPVEGEAEIGGDAGYGYDAGLADKTCVYTFETEKTVLLSQIFAMYMLPVPTTDVETVMLLGGGDLADPNDLVLVEPLQDARQQTYDYRITALRSFDGVRLSVPIASTGDVYTLVLSSSLVTAGGDAEVAEAEAFDLGGDDEPADVGNATYAYSLGGASQARLGDIISACGMPIAAGDVEMVALAGGRDSADAPVLIEDLGGDYLITAQENFSDARLLVYTAQDTYALILTDGSWAEPDVLDVQDGDDVFLPEPAEESVPEEVTLDLGDLDDETPEPDETPVQPGEEPADEPGEALTAEPVDEQTIATETEEELTTEPVEEQPVEEQTTEPVEGQTEEPVEEQVTEPVEEQVTEPVEEQTTEPEEEQPTKPVEERTTEPVEEQVNEPVEEQTTEPVEEQPTEPVEEQPTEPVEEQPTEPVEEQPTEPVEEQPTKPVEEQVNEPVEEQPTKPVEEQVKEPVDEQTTEPVEDQPTEPVEEKTTEPDEDQPTEPDEEQPTEPDEEQPTEPDEEQADEPVEEPLTYPAQSYAGGTAHVRVQVDAPEGAFPEGTTMEVTPNEDSEVLADIADAVAEDFVEVKSIYAVDIAFHDAEGAEIEPLLPTAVVMSVDAITEAQRALIVHVNDAGVAETVEQTAAPQTHGDALDLNMELSGAAQSGGQQPVAEQSAAEQLVAEQPVVEPQVVEQPIVEPQVAEQTTAEPSVDTQYEAESYGDVPDEILPEPVDDAVPETETDLSFEADAFSTYAVVIVETVASRRLDASGENWAVELDYGADAGIPADAALQASEMTGAVAEVFTEQAARVLDVDVDSFTYVKVLDMAIVKDGEALQPQVPVSVSVQLHDLPEGVTAEDDLHVVHFSAIPRALDCAVEGETVTFEADGFSAYVIAFRSERQYPAQSFEARAAGVSVSVDAQEGAFPEGTTMRVKRVMDRDTVSDIREAVAGDFVEVRRVQVVDIAFHDAEGREIEPLLPVSVVMTVTGMKEEQEAVVVHVDDAGAVNVQSSEVQDTPSGSMDVSFDADVFSMYAVVVTETIQTKYIDAEGNTWAVEVGYGADAGIPSGAVLEVRELTGAAAEDYIAQAAEALDAGGVTYAKALDIAIVVDGEEVHPAQPVRVSIRLLDAPEDLEEEYVNVVHFGDAPEALDCALDGETVAFETDGFSVYVVLTGVNYMTFKFHVYDDSTWTQYGTEQRIKNGEKPRAPMPPSDDTQGLEFAGWYRYESSAAPAGPTGLQNWNDANGNWTVDDGERTDKPYDFDNIPSFSASGAVDLYAGYERFANVIFHDQYDSETEKWPVAFSRRVELKQKLDSQNEPVVDGDGNPVYEGTVQIDDLRTNYSGSENLACYGWSTVPVETPGVYKNPSTGTPYAISSDDGFYTVTKDTDLYPIYRVFHRLTFHAAKAGEDAEYVPTQTQFEDEGFGVNGTLPKTSRPGYVFKGWFIGTMYVTTENGQTKEEVLYGSQVTDEDGSLGKNGIPYLMTPVAGVSVDGNALRIAADTTLYAKWDEAPETPQYQLVFWKQSQPDSQSYVYYTTVTLPAEGQQASFNPDATLPNGVDLAGYTYVRDDGPKILDNSGTATLNVYYKLNDDFTPEDTYTLTFADSMDGAAMTTVNVAYNASVRAALSIINTTPEDKKSDQGRVIYKFGGWYMDRDCTIPANLDGMTMPACDVTVYARWEAEWFIVNIDPNYGALYTQKSDGSLEGTGSTWFWQTWESELIGEYTHVTRDYVRSSGGDHYYVNRDRAFYGYSGTEYDKSEAHRETYYTSNPGEDGASDETYEYAPGAYSYVGWYEVYPDGSEAAEPYDFSRHTDHNLTLRLRWKRSGDFYLAYDAGDGYLDSENTISKDTVSNLTEVYADQAEVVLKRQVYLSDTADEVFIGWRLRGDTSGVVYPIGGTFTLHAEDAGREGGKDVVWLEAVYADAGSDKVTVVYDANGGTVGESYDSGKRPGTDGNGTVNASGTKDGNTVTVQGLDNNSEYILSDGTGFSWMLNGVNNGNQITPAGWSNTRVYNPDDPASELYTCGGVYGVDINGGNTTTVYAAWPVTVTYVLNNANGSWNSANWGDAYTYTPQDGNYRQTRYIGWVNGAVAGSPVQEPKDIPTSTDEKMFYYWTEDASVQNPTPYDFSQPVTKDLTLYAVWDGPVAVPVHAVDASEAALLEKTSDWDAAGATIPVGAEDVALNVSKAGKYVTSLPDDYEYAFAAALNESEALDREKVSESRAIQAVYYNQAKKHLYVQYADTTRADAILEEDTEIYFFYYKKKALDIGYAGIDAKGVLEYKTPTSAPNSTKDAQDQELKLGAYDVTASLTSPMTWVEGYSCYAYAIGDQNAGNASQLRAITQTATSDVDRPALRVKNSWQGFLYSMDGETTWKSCGYDPQLYVVYFEEKPTVIMLHEETLGTANVLNKEFSYHIVVTNVVNGIEDTEHPVYDSDNVDNGEQHAYKLTNGGVQSAVLFYEGDTETAQKITVTQKEDGNSPNFTTTVGTAETREWTCTSTAEGGTVDVNFKNTHKALPVEVHVAFVGENGVALRDDLRSENYSFPVELGKTEAILEKLPSSTVYNNNAYALGAIGYGTDNGETVTIRELGLNTIAYGQVSGNHYELLINGESGRELGEYKVYYLYYPAVHISYKKTGGATLEDVEGYQATNGMITYGGRDLWMNGAQVMQDQLLPIPVNGVLTINQSGSGSFRMPPYLDDNSYLRYLSYESLGFGDSGETDEGEIMQADDNTLYFRVDTTGLQRSSNGEDWESIASGTPTVYAIYRERGYDLMITKTVPAQKSELSSLFMGATFTVTIRSAAITKESYTVEGYDSETIPATPADGTTLGSITLSVGDGSAIRILGLSQGSYTVTETQNENYDLTAKKGKIIGGTMSSIEVKDNAITFNLDSETKLALTNSPHRLCRIVDNGVEHIFFTFADAIKYVEDNVSSLTATIEMLSDYTVPLADRLTIPYGYTITLDNAAPLYSYGDVDPKPFDTFSDAIDYVEQIGVLTGNNTVRINYHSDELDETKLQNAIPARYRAMIELKKASAVEPQPAKTIIRSEELSAQPVIENGGRLTICNLTLDGANITAAKPLIQSGGDLTIGEGAIIQYALHTGNGGAINATAGNINVSGKLSNNRSDADGGAIYYSGDGTITVNGSALIQNNQATGTDENTGNGGAICASSGTIDISGSAQIKNNRAVGKGGAIYGMSAVVNVTGETEISSNTAVSGGAVCIETGAVTVSDTLDPETGDPLSPKIQKNKATGTDENTGNGGAIYVGSGSVTVRGGTLGGNSSADRNTATGKGGAIYAQSANVTLESVKLYTATSADEEDVMSVVTVRNNRAPSGGAIYAGSGTVTATDVGMTENTATTGDGGAICADSGNVSLSGVSMSKNKAENGKGGAVYANIGNVTVTDSTLGGDASTDACTAKNGGAVYAESGAVNITDSILKHNNASENGGAVYAKNGNVTVTMSDGKSMENNSAQNGGAVYAEKGTVSVSGGEVKSNTATTGNGGAICTDSGSVTLSATAVTGNSATAGHGGAVYSGTGSVNLTGCTTVTGNTAASGNGGVVCTDKGGVTVSDCTIGGAGDENANTARNGGAVFAESGNITVSGKTDLQYNTATVHGGAIYEGDGTVNINGTADKTKIINIKNNSAVNGAAVYVASGVGMFSGSGDKCIYVQNNTATTGGAVGVGSSDARLYFSGKVYVNNNTHTQADGDSANVYLDQDTDSVINAAGLNGSSEVGIYVPGPFTGDLFKNRGAASALFGSYSSNSNLGKFKNDRNIGLTAQQADNNKIRWVKALTVEVRYIPSFEDGFPPRQVDPLFTLTSYVMPTSTNGASQIAEDIYANYETDKLKTLYPKAGFACVFKDGETSFDYYLTDVNWDGETGKWKFIRRDGDKLTDITKLIVYFADTSYLSIVNNTTDQLTLSVSSLSVLGRDAVDKGYYGYVTAKNGMTPDTMKPIADSDLTLAPGQSRKFLFPGAMGQDITLTGTFSGGTVPDSIQYIVDGDEEHPKTLSLNGETHSFELLNPDSTPANEKYTLRAKGETREFIFGEKALEICQVRLDSQDVNATDLPKFPSFKSAIAYIVDQKTRTGNNKYNIEMLVDYLLPSSDKCELPGGYDITLTTASSYAGDRATISRDAGNMSDAIVKFINDKNTFVNNAITGTLTIENLIFDGRSLAGSGDGGAVTTMNACVMIDNCLFKGVEATNGGAIFVDFTASNSANTPYQNQNENAKQATLTITNTEFLDCRSSSNVDKTGGGAIWTTARVLALDHCTFTRCSCYKDNPGKGTAQAGAVFHNINDNSNMKDVLGDKKPTSYSNNTETYISNCTFTDCYVIQASGGAVESDALKIELVDCTFDTCYVKRGKNGGGLNIYANNEENPSKTCYTTVRGCTFINCSSPNNGGAFRTTSTIVTVEDTSFTKCSGKFGGGFAAMGSKAKSLTLEGVIVDSCTALSGGYAGGIYCTATTVWIKDTNDGKHTEIKNCTAPGQGGGIYHNRTGNDTSFEMTNAVVTGNSATNSTGGGVHTFAQEVCITGGSIFNNTSKNQGGGIYVNPQNNADSTLSITGTTVSGNTSSSSDGGGVWYNGKDDNVCMLYLYGCTINGNSANTGGGVYTQAKIVYVNDYEGQHASISNNTARNGNGGGIYHSRDITGSALNVTNAEIKGNESKTGSGGGVWTNARTLTLTGADVSGNTAKNYGGGIYHSFAADANNSNLSITGTTISGCRATAGNGGGVYTNVRTLSITDSTVSGCTSTGSGGGVWYDGSDATARGVMELSLSGSDIKTNTAGTHGGGVYTGVDTVIITGGTISNNEASNGNGGGIHQQSSATGSTLTVTGAEIKGNHVYGTGTSGKGGGVYAKAGTVTITGGEISGNTASRNGGGICHDSAAMNRDLILYGTLVKENQAGEKGGGVYFAASDGAAINSEGKVEPYAHLTMRNGTQVIDNRLSGSAGNAAGVYLPDYASLYVGIVPKSGQEDATFDTVVVKDNQTTAGHPSDLRLWSNSDGQNNENSVYINCGLTIKDDSDSSKPYSEVRVVNANRAGTRFGFSHINNPRGFVQGFSTDKAVFKADDDTLFGVIDRAQTKKIYIIWGGPAICKITDPVGNLLYLNRDSNGKGADPAVFDLLDTGDVNDTSINSAFSLLRAEHPELYYTDGAPYSDTKYCVKMLDSYTTQNRIIIPAGKTITFTTAGRDDDDYPYEYSKTYKTKGDVATVTRGKNVGNNPLVNTETNLTLLNLILDGGSLLTGTEKPEAGSSTSLLYMRGDNITVTLKGATLQNSETTGNGGGIHVAKGKLILGEDVQNGDAQIRNCKALNGGGVYAAAYAEVEFRRGQVYGCEASGGDHNGSGGGIYLANGTGEYTLANGTGEYTMTGGIISRCKATSNGSSGGSGGGIYVGNKRHVTMKGGKIQENHATHRGGGIAVDDKGSQLFFAQTPVISQNTCDKSMASGKICNVEMDRDTNAIIQTVEPGLYNGASIGVYVPDAYKDTNTLYNDHGTEAKPFGTYAETGDMTTFYSFVNDRNGLKGGLMGSDDAEHRIYWVKIFSLEVAIRNSPDVPRDQEFEFQVTLSGNTSVADQKHAKDIHGYYGQMYFYSDGVNATRSPVKLKLSNASDNWDDGMSCIGENLSQDLRYVVTPKLNDDKQVGRYVLIPMSHSGKIGEFNEEGVSVDESERYISRAVFKIIPAVCKLTDSSGNLLYYRYEDEYRKKLNPNHDGYMTGVIHYLPAVFSDLNSAVEVLNNAAIYAADSSDPSNALYYSSTVPYAVTQGIKIQMLTDFKQTEAIELPNIPITLTTASTIATAADPYRYYGSGNKATIRRDYDDESMFTVANELTLTSIILDGTYDGTNHKTVTGKGGFVCVKGGGKLKIETEALLQRSNSTADGGAVYAESGATVEMNAGAIQYNTTTGNGAGIYLESGANMKLSGNPLFMGNSAGAFSDPETNGPTFTYTPKRQDIYLVEKEADPASLIVTGDLTGKEGSIWVWAEKSRHYEQLMPFAVLELPEGVSFVNPEEDTPDNVNKLDVTHLKVFRNAQPDSATGNGTETWLFGTLREDTPGYVCWSGVEGLAHVMLVKVLRQGNSYKDLPGKTFTVYTKNGRVAKGTVYKDDGTVDDQFELKDLTSGEGTGGAFFIGELAYGEYYAVEEGVPGQFDFVIDDGGVVRITDPESKPKKTEPVKTVNLTTP